MDYYSEKDYERAILYRDKVKSIRDTQKKQNVLTEFENLDVLVLKEINLVVVEFIKNRR